MTRPRSSHDIVCPSGRRISGEARPPCEAVFRPARLEGANPIARLMREGVSDRVRRITIMESPRLGDFVAEVVGKGHEDFTVGAIGDRLVGICAWRQEGATLQLNHLYVCQDMRGRGIGTALALDGLRRLGRRGAGALHIDVFTDNPSALRWYRSWGMRQDTQFDWFECPIPSFLAVKAGNCTIDQWCEAEVSQRRHEFSHFTLKTHRGSYRIGRLGARYFRASSIAILNDAIALHHLNRLDSARSLLCIGALRDVPDTFQGAAALVAQSDRLAGSCSRAIRHLTAAMARRRGSIHTGSIHR